MNSSNKIDAFNSLYTSNHIQMLKILSSAVDPSMRGRLATYIKYMELQQTLKMNTPNPDSYGNAVPPSFHFHSRENNNDQTNTLNQAEILQIIDELLPYCNLAEKEQLNQIKSLLENLENMKEMMEVMQMMQDDPDSS